MATEGTSKVTRCLTVRPGRPEPALIAEAAAVIRDGGLVAFPTETVYGLGANALDPRAVAGIFAAKERPAYDPLIVHLSDSSQLPIVAAEVPGIARTLAEVFWPGPLTLVLLRGPRVLDVVTAGGETVAVRVPSHPVARALIAAAGVPIAAPSANRFGRVSPTSAAHVLADLGGRVDLVLDGGTTRVGVESTVLSVLSDPPVILRPGGVSREALERHVGPVALAMQQTLDTDRLLSPGTTTKHYAPRARVTLFKGEVEDILSQIRQVATAEAASGEKVGVLVAQEDLASLANLPVVLQSLGPAMSMTQIARRLYASLRALDEAGVTVILARDFGSLGLGLAIQDRLTRAAAGRVVEVSPDGT